MEIISSRDNRSRSEVRLQALQASKHNHFSSFFQHFYTHLSKQYRFNWQLETWQKAENVKTHSWTPSTPGFALMKRVRSFSQWEMSPVEAIKGWLKDWNRLLLSSVFNCRLTCGLWGKLPFNLTVLKPAALHTHTLLTKLSAQEDEWRKKKLRLHFAGLAISWNLKAPATIFTHQTLTFNAGDLKSQRKRAVCICHGWKCPTAVLTWQ